MAHTLLWSQGIVGEKSKGGAARKIGGFVDFHLEGERLLKKPSCWMERWGGGVELAPAKRLMKQGKRVRVVMAAGVWRLMAVVLLRSASD